MLHEKRSELLRLLLISGLLALTIGVVFVLSADSSTPSKATPGFVNASANHTINFSMTGRSTTDQRVDITKPSGVTTIDCAVFVPSGWDCDDTSSTTVVTFTNSDGLAEGVTANFSIASVFGSNTGNQTFTIDTYENTAGTVNRTTLKSNVTVDADAPLITSINISDGLRVWNGSAPTMWVNGSALAINATITDFHSGINAASVYYNLTNFSQHPIDTFPHPSVGASYDPAVLALSAAGNADQYTATIPANRLFNGTVVFFTVVANDTVQNTNVTNSTASPTAATASFNVTVDSVPPLVIGSPNILDEVDAAEDNIMPSDVVVTITLNVSDDGGSGVSRVDINASADTGWVNMTQNGTGVDWYFNGTLQSLGVPAGDNNLTLYFRAYDNLSNENTSLSTLNLLVDDDAPQFAVGLFNPANVSEEVLRQNYTTSNITPINFSILVYGNLNYTGSVYANSTTATIMGPDDRIYNLSLLSSTTLWDTNLGNANQLVYSSLWYSAQSPQNGPNSLNSTNSSLATLGCDILDPDGGVCPILINVTDIFGRSNTTNISITFDNVSASVTNITQNATSSSVQVVRSGSIINFSANAGNSIQNVTIHNASEDAQLNNATVLTSFGGTNYSVAVETTIVCGDGVEGICTVNFSSVDKALNINRSGIDSAKAQLASTTFFVDNSAPLVSNFKINGTTSASFRRVAGTTGLVVTSSIDLNITFNVTDQITNVTQVNLGNATLRNSSNHVGDAASFQNSTTLANFGCPANVEGVTCTLRAHAIDNLSIDNLANENNSVNLTFIMDDLSPRVVNFSTSLVNGNGFNVTSVNTVINFSVNITDQNIDTWNVSIQNTTTLKMNRSAAPSDNTSSVTYWASVSINDLGCTSDGDCLITINATDMAGNNNDSESIFVTSDSSVLAINNRTFGATFLSSQPTLHVNTSVNALCRYSTTGVNNYSQMSTQFGTEGTRHNSFALTDTLDAENYEYDVSCVDAAGSNVQSSTVKFTVDTTSLWNVTIGKNGYNAGTGSGSYFTESTKFYTFSMDNTILLSDAPYLSGTTVNVTNVLDRLVSANPSGSDNNLTILYALNSTDGTVTSFVPGRASGNTLNNFTADGLTYYVNLSNANERVEIT